MFSYKNYCSDINLKPKKKHIARDIKSFQPRNGFLFDNQSQSFPAISDHLVDVDRQSGGWKTYIQQIMAHWV